VPQRAVGCERAQHARGRCLLGRASAAQQHRQRLQVGAGHVNIKATAKIGTYDSHMQGERLHNRAEHVIMNAIA